jgi:hypothetical protein
MRIISADERINENSGIKGVIFGPAKIGKTSLLWTLDAATTLFVDMEAGGLSVRDWKGDSVEVTDWQTAKNLACWLGGPDMARVGTMEDYSDAHYAHVCQTYGDPAILAKYKTIFIDSITVLGRLCFGWCKRQPQAFSEKTGKPDTRGAYGLHGQEMIGILTRFQRAKGKSVWLVGLLDEKTDDYGRKTYQAQIDGSKTGLELPGIVDQVITMAALPDGEGKLQRQFVCSNPNDFGFPAGDRSGALNTIEPAHLGKLMDKILAGMATSPATNLTYTNPTTTEE